MSITKKKIKVHKNQCEYIFRLMSILLNIFQTQKLMNKTTKAEILFLRRKDKKHQKKNLVAHFIRTNTRDGKRGYNTDYEVSKIQIFISNFKEKTVKEKENKIKKLEDKIKKLKLQFTSQSV